MKTRFLVVLALTIFLATIMAGAAFAGVAGGSVQQSRGTVMIGGKVISETGYIRINQEGKAVVNPDEAYYFFTWTKPTGSVSGAEKVLTGNAATVSEADYFYYTRGSIAGGVKRASVDHSGQTTHQTVTQTTQTHRSQVSGSGNRTAYTGTTSTTRETGRSTSELNTGVWAIEGKRYTIDLGGLGGLTLDSRGTGNDQGFFNITYNRGSLTDTFSSDPLWFSQGNLYGELPDAGTYIIDIAGGEFGGGYTVQMDTNLLDTHTDFTSGAFITRAAVRSADQNLTFEPTISRETRYADQQTLIQYERITTDHYVRYQSD